MKKSIGVRVGMGPLFLICSLFLTSLSGCMGTSTPSGDSVVNPVNDPDKGDSSKKDPADKDSSKGSDKDSSTDSKDKNPKPPIVAVYADDEVNQWTVEQIRALSVDQLQSLTPTQVSTLDVKKVFGLAQAGSTSSLKNLNQAQTLALTDPQLTELKKLSLNEQFHAFTPEQVQWIRYDFFTRFSASQEVLSPPPIPRLLVRLFSHRWTFGKPQNISQVTAENMKHYDFATEGGALREFFLSADSFTVEHIRALGSLPRNRRYFYSFPILSGEQLKEIPAGLFRGISADQLDFISEDQVRSLTQDQLKPLADYQIDYVSKTFWAALYPEIASASATEIAPDTLVTEPLKMRAFLSLHLGELSAAQIQSIPPQGFHFLSHQDIAPSNRLVEDGILREYDWWGIPSSQSLYEYAEKQAQSMKSDPVLTREQIAAIDAAQVMEIRAHLFSSFNADQFSGFTVPAIQALSPAQVAAINVEIQPEQFKAMSAKQVASLNHLAFSKLKPAHFKDLDPSIFNGIKGALNGDVIGNLTVDQTKALTIDQIRLASGSLGAPISKLRPEQVAVLSAEQVAAIYPVSFSGFSAVQISQIKPNVIDKLGEEHLAVLTSENANGLTTEQVKELSVSQFAQLGTKVNGYYNGTDPGRVHASLSDDVLKGLTAEQVPVIPPYAFHYFTGTQLGQFTPENRGKFTDEQLKYITAQAISELDVEVVKLLPENQLRIFGANSHQKQVFNTKFLSVLSKEQGRWLRNEK